MSMVESLDFSIVSRGRRIPSYWSILGILTAPYIGCLHWEKMELLHVLVPMCPGYPIDPWLLWVSLLHEPSRESRASSGCFISLVSRLREDGASACSGDFGCSVLECTFYMNHLKNLEFHLAAPYLGCLHREKMELLHVLEILAPLCFECSYYMNHLENLELHLVHPDP